MIPVAGSGLVGHDREHSQQKHDVNVISKQNR